MIVLTETKMAALGRASRHRNYAEVVAFFQKAEPRIFGAMSPDEQIRFIDGCHGTALRYGFDSMAALYVFADLAVLLGSDFWRDPIYGGIAQELTLRSRQGSALTLGRVRSQVSARLQKLRGPDGRMLAASLTAFNAIYRPGSSAARGGATQSPDEQAMALIIRVAPSVIRICGQQVVADRNRAVIGHAQRRYGLTDGWVLGTFCLMSALLGIGFDTDPQYPWIGRELARSGEIGPERAVMNVSARLVDWFDAAISEVQKNDID